MVALDLVGASWSGAQTLASAGADQALVRVGAGNIPREAAEN